MNPYLIHLVYGIVTNSLSSAVDNATVEIVTSVARKIYTTNSDGIYMANLADIGYVAGEIITINVTEPFNNEVKTHLYTVSGDSSQEDITLELRTAVDRVSELQRQNVLHSVGKTPITLDNRLPVDSKVRDSSDNLINPATTGDVELISEQFQKTAFSELSVAEVSPVVQVQFPYNINTDIWEIRNNGGSSTVVDNKANISTGSGADQSSTILTKTPVKYNPGQGGLVRFTARYTKGVANSTQWAGIGNSTDGYFFGYNGANFGILRRQGGKPETRRLQITTASNAGEDLTITLNGVAETVTVTAAGADSATTRVVTANDIVAHTDWADVGEGWEVHNMGANVFFTSFTDGSKTVTYSISVPDTGDGTFSQSLAGVSSTETIINQTSWNHDKMDGTGDSGMTLDPTKGNVFQIRYQWLGFGIMGFYIEGDTADGELVLVHHIHYANQNTIPSIDNPTLPLCASAKNTSNESDIVLQIGSMGGFVEGRDTLKGLPHALSVEKTGISTAETPVMTIHSHDIYQSTINRVKIKMTVGSISVDGTKNSIIRIRKNAVITGPVAFTPLNSSISTIHRDTSATGVSGGIVVFALGTAKVDEIVVDLEKLGIEVVAPDFLTVTVQATAAASVDVIATLNWQELF